MQSHDSETWITVFTFFEMSLQKNVKSYVFWIVKKREKDIHNLCCQVLETLCCYVWRSRPSFQADV